REPDGVDRVSLRQRVLPLPAAKRVLRAADKRSGQEENTDKNRSEQGERNYRHPSSVVPTASTASRKIDGSTCPVAAIRRAALSTVSCNRWPTCPRVHSQ